MSRKLSFLPLIMTALLIIFPSLSLEGAARGIQMWAENMVPTLFPFMAVSTMLINSGALSGFAKMCSRLTEKMGIPRAASQTLLVGTVSGYPVGAGMTSMLFKQNKINDVDVCFTAAVSSFCSPIFIISTIGVKMLGNAGAGIIILASHYISFAVTLFLFVKFGAGARNTSQTEPENEEKSMPIGALLKASVESAVKTILTVGGYVVLFSILIEFISKCNILPETGFLSVLIPILLELSNGCAAVCKAAVPLAVKIMLLCFCTTWGGLCVIFQINGFISECKVSCKKLVLFKLIQACVSALCGFALSSLILKQETALMSDFWHKYGWALLAVFVCIGVCTALFYIFARKKQRQK